MVLYHHPEIIALKISHKNTCLIPFCGILGFLDFRMLCDLADFVHMSGTIEVLWTPASVQILVMGQWGMLHTHWSGKNKLVKKGRHQRYSVPVPYRIQNCFSTISAKILVNHYYFRDFWRVLWCKSLWITHIFAINSDTSVALIVTVMSAMPSHQL